MNKKIGTGFLIDSAYHGSTYVILQTPFMKQALRDTMEDFLYASTKSPDAGWHGFVTNGNYSFFYSGMLLATAAFNLTLRAWVPVLYTWVGLLDTELHCKHFCVLNEQILLLLLLYFLVYSP